MNDENQHIWRDWAEKLHRWGLDGGIAVLLEVAGPFNLLAAQAIYLGQPLLNGWMSSSGLNALAGMLEDPSKTQVFVQTLREVPKRESSV